jgi:hypothetical protein
MAVSRLAGMVPVTVLVAVPAAVLVAVVAVVICGRPLVVGHY